MPAVKEKPKTKKLVEDVDVGITETTDLKKEQEQIERLNDRIARLQKKVEVRRNNHEINLQQIKRTHDETTAKKRAEYDACLDKGDANAADKCLAEIRKGRADLVNLAKNILDSDRDISDLKERQNELLLETIRLCEMATANAQKAKQLSGELPSPEGIVSANTLLYRVSDCIGSDFRKIDRTLEQSKKLAEQILLSE